MVDLSAPFNRATLALSMLAVDPGGLGGLTLRARSGPVRDAVVAMPAMLALANLPLPLTRLHPGISDAALYGGLDLSATLAQGRIVQEQGLLRDPSAMIMTMAERTPPPLAARLALTLDEGRGH